MKVAWIVLLDVLIAIFAFFTNGGLFNLIAHFRVTVPLTDEMIVHGIIDKKNRKQLISIEFFSTLITSLIPLGLGIVVAIFSGLSGFITFAAVLIIALVFFRPTADRYNISPYSIAQYALSHSICMDMDKFERVYFRL